MTTTPPAGQHAAPTWKPIEASQRRVLGVLIEKAKTTPAGYPMTVNAIVTGCNQKNNREPVTAYDDVDVENALGGLRTLGVVSEIDWMGRSSKFKHHAYEWLGVSKVEMAVMAELLLRGAQALGDLRGRAARMEPIADLAALKPIVETLLERRLMVELTAPGRGQIVSHGLYLAHELAELKSRFAGHVPQEGSSAHDETVPRQPGLYASPPARAPLDSELGAQVAELRAEVRRLDERIRILEARLDD